MHLAIPFELADLAVFLKLEEWGEWPGQAFQIEADLKILDEAEESSFRTIGTAVGMWVPRPSEMDITDFGDSHSGELLDASIAYKEGDNRVPWLHLFHFEIEKGYAGKKHGALDRFIQRIVQIQAANMVYVTCLPYPHGKEVEVKGEAPVYIENLTGVPLPAPTGPEQDERIVAFRGRETPFVAAVEKIADRLSLLGLTARYNCGTGSGGHTICHGTLFV
tara:strand:- start:975 stop:1634 length:660 start_codon:yes stop_codon:yes gene_type:complete